MVKLFLMKTHAHTKVSDLEFGLSEGVSQVIAALPVMQVSKVQACALNPLSQLRLELQRKVLQVKLGTALI